MTDRLEVQRITLPEGMLVNHSLFQRDQFDPQAKPSYKVEIAFERGVLDEVENELAAAAVAKWGDGSDIAYDNGDIISPVLDGDQLAKRREEKDKPGDAYKGKDVVRAHTIFNMHGVEGPGGVPVYGPDVAEIDVTQSQEVYGGCYGCAGVTIGTYDDNRGSHALMFYLLAFQKTRDGTPLISARDHSELFKPVGRDQDGGTGGRRRRKG